MPAVHRASLLLSISLQAACVSTSTEPYPNNWPAPVNDSSCADLSGIYLNSAESTTDRQPAALFFLSDLLRAGVTGSPEAPSRINIRVELGGTIKFADADEPHKSDEMRTNAVCDGVGTLFISFEAEMTGEGTAVGREKIFLRLFRAVDGSLIVRREGRGRRLGTLLIPLFEVTEVWFRFVRVSGA